MNEYKSRSIKFIELVKTQSWNIKLYTITCKTDALNNELINAAKSKLKNWLSLAETKTLVNDKTGFMIVHDAKDGNYILLSWWVNENMLEHYVYYSPKDKLKFARFRYNNIIACVWELSVICFEKNAWVENVLKNASQNYEAYLNEQLNAEY